MKLSTAHDIRGGHRAEVARRLAPLARTQRGMTGLAGRLIDEMCGPFWFHDEPVGQAGAVFTIGNGDASAGCEMEHLQMPGNPTACRCVLVPFPMVSREFGVYGTPRGPHVRMIGEDIVALDPGPLLAEVLDGVIHHVAAVAPISAAGRGSLSTAVRR